MTIENIDPQVIKEAIELLHKKAEGQSIVTDLAKGKYHIKWGVTKTRIINYTVSFILISTLIYGMIWLMKF